MESTFDVHGVEPVPEKPSNVSKRVEFALGYALWLEQAGRATFGHVGRAEGSRCVHRAREPSRSPRSSRSGRTGSGATR